MSSAAKSAPPPDLSKATVTGWLEKRSDKFKRYKRRFFAIVGSRAYFFVKEGGKVRGVLQVTADTRVGDVASKPSAKPGDKFEFEVALPNRTVRLCARHPDAKAAWIEAFFDAIDEAHALGVTAAAVHDASSSGSDGTVPEEPSHRDSMLISGSDAASQDTDHTGGVTFLQRLRGGLGALGLGPSSSVPAPVSSNSGGDVLALSARVEDLKLRVEQTEAALAAEREERSVYEEALKRLQGEATEAARNYEARIDALLYELHQRDMLIDTFRTQLGAQQWVANNERNECRRCLEPFTFTRRRHHCRRCGEIFCGDCASHRVPLIAGKSGEKIRVCVDCALITDVAIGAGDM